MLTQPLVAIVMGSQSDWPTMRYAAETLDALKIEYEARIVSAHRTPDRLVQFAQGAKADGFKVIIAGAGAAAHLPGMIASMTPLPVFGVPVKSRALSGQDSLLSIVQMPAGIPVGTLAIGESGATNAALLAAAVLALFDRDDRGGPRSLPQRADCGGPRISNRRCTVMRRCRSAVPSASSAADNWAACWRSPQRGWGCTPISTAPTRLSPAFDVTPLKTIAAYDDEKALARFAAAVDVVTYEFENVPARTAELLSRWKPLRPGANALAISQDRLLEKAFLTTSRIPVAAFAAVGSAAGLKAALKEIGLPAVLKTTRLGYDGKGQRIVRTAADAELANAELAPKPLVLEAFVPFEKEISIIVARNAAGHVAAYEPSENVHRDHILKTSTVPASIKGKTAARAIELASQIVTALDYVGVLGVEFFVLAGGKLLVNEIAPRVHNSGHWTEAVCVTDQFEQHIRAVLNWPLGDPTRLADVVMENLIGDEIDDDFRDVDAAQSSACLRQDRVAARPQDGPHQPHRHENPTEIGGFLLAATVDKRRRFIYIPAPR